MTAPSSELAQMQHHYEWFFETLANPLRMRILLMLMKKPLSVNEMVKETGEEQSKVSHALRILTLCRLVRMSKKGRMHIYQAENQRVKPLFRLVDQSICSACGACCRQDERKKKIKRVVKK
ncbi:Bacterial regulatory protein, arsR family [uncultured archaeon]|nr:Bacterial regulatory protein, arsR family [uncultured archaeon]